MQKKQEAAQTIQRRIKDKNSLKIQYKIQLNEEQKEAKRAIMDNTITVLTGKAGSGKTQVAILTALDLLFKGSIEKIFITRPMVTREELGFLPGDIQQKLDPILLPIYDCLHNAYDKQRIDKAFQEKEIEIAPIAYMRGRTVQNAILIVDETQNIDDETMKMCLTRIGKNGKIVLCGDIGQIDLKYKSLSGLHFICTLQGKVQGLVVKELKTNHRNEILDSILYEYEKRDEMLAAMKTLKALQTPKTTTEQHY